MNSDFRIHVGLVNHPKLARLERRIGKDAALGHLVRFWTGVAVHRPGGNLDGWDFEDWADVARWSGDPLEFARALIDCGFVDVMTDGSHKVHGWKEHNTWASEANNRSDKAKQAAKARWDRKMGINSANSANSDAQAMLKQCSSNAKSCSEQCSGNAPSPIPSPSPSPSPSPNPSPIPIPSPKEKDKDLCIPYGIHSSPAAPDDAGARKGKPDNCPYSDILDAFHRICPDLPRCESLGKTVQAKIKARWRTGPETQNLFWWEAYFERVAESDFLCGRKTDFRAALSWLVGPINMDKVLSGQYDNHYARHIDKNMLAQARESEEFMRIMEAREAERNGTK